MRLTGDDDIVALLNRTRTIAVLGVSLKPERPSHRVFHYLCGQGYDAIPVNPGLAGQHIAGREIYARLTDIDRPVDMVDVFRNSRFLPEIIDHAIAIGAKSVWTQLDVDHPDAIDKAVAHGLDAVVNRCPAIEIPRLSADGHVIQASS